MPRAHDHERLVVYDLAVEFSRWTEQTLAELPGRRRDLARQLDRASSSIVLNISEGAGEYTPREKARFYRMARRSATECGGAVDLLTRVEAVDRKRARQAQRILQQIAAILTTMCRNLEAKGRAGAKARASRADQPQPPRES